MNSAQRSAADAKRGRLLRTVGDDVCAHLSEGLNDAIHRATAERRISDQSRFKSLAGEQAGEQTHACARTTAVELVFWWCQDAFFSVHDQDIGLRLFNLDPECAQGVDRVHAVVAREKTAQGTHPIRKGSDNYSAMRDAFVPGDSDFRLDSRRSFYA
jgi:hypothetical protein